MTTRISSMASLQAILLICAFSFAETASTATEQPPDFLLRDDVWEQLVLPADASSRSLRELFADDLPADGYGVSWALFQYDGGANQYVAPELDDSLPIGTGFWMLQKTGSDVVLDLPVLPLAEGSGGSRCITSGDCVAVPLDSRAANTTFSMVGSALTEASAPGDLGYRSTQGSGPCRVGCDLAQAIENDRLINAIFQYDADAGSYLNLLQGGTLDVWKSAWFATGAAAHDTGANILFPSGPGEPEPPVGSSNCLGAPALPSIAVSDPGKSVVNVSSDAELQAAVGALTDNTVILIAPGQYQLSNTLWIQNNNVTIRGDSNNCDDVVLIGPGMENSAGSSNVPHGVWTASDNLKVQNLTIRDVYFHPIIINGDGDQPQIYNVQLLDAGQQFIKANPAGFGSGSDSGRVEYTIMKYTSGPPSSDHGGGTGYTNGVDVHGGQGWVIRNNLFENFHTPDSAQNLWNPAILMWNGARDTLVENNRFIDVDRAIAFGLLNRANDHAGGIIRNNMIVVRPNLFSTARRNETDAQIIVWSSPGTAVIHNTIMTQGNMNKAIELRFNSAGSVVHNNLVDAPIVHRDGAGFDESGNVNTSDTSIFSDPATADLHLVRDANGISNAVSRRSEAPRDFDGDSRPANLADVGADER